MEDRYQAKFTHTASGWDDGIHGRKYLDTETLYDIDWIDIHSYHTRVYLKDVEIDENDKRWFNSVYFTFYLNGNPVAKEDEWEFFREAGANTDEWESDDDCED